jgi:TolA-binding protein
MMMKRKALFLILATLFSHRSEAVPEKPKLKPQGSALWQELTGENLEKMDDQTLYSEAVGHYQARDPKALARYLATLIRRFPASPFADNALFLGGELALEMKNYPEALRYFHQITRLYPLSNRVVAAQFSKGIAYKKMNLEIQAKKVFFELRRKYPGSPESFRAEAELKLFR